MEYIYISQLLKFLRFLRNRYLSTNKPILGYYGKMHVDVVSFSPIPTYLGENNKIKAIVRRGPCTVRLGFIGLGL